MSNMVEAGLSYIAQGFSIFPVKPDKKPLTPHGLKDATQTQSGVIDYWTRWPEAGIALLTDGLIVIDFDVKSGGLESKAILESTYGPLPQTRVHRTGGGGEHWIYRSPNGYNVRNGAAIAGYKGVDIRANGGYIGHLQASTKAAEDTKFFIRVTYSPPRPGWLNWPRIKPLNRILPKSE